MYNQYPYNPYNQYQQNVIPYQSQTKQEIVRVNGENGARAYSIAPNSSVLLLDEQLPIVYLKVTDGGGYPTITPYSITPYQAESPVDLKTLEQRITRLEGLVKNESNNSDAE